MCHEATNKQTNFNNVWIQDHIAITYCRCLHRLWSVNEVLRSADGCELLCTPVELKCWLVSATHYDADLGRFTGINSAWVNATLSDIQLNLLRRLQAVLNAYVRTITGLPRSAHIMTSLAGLLWLCAAERINSSCDVDLPLSVHRSRIRFLQILKFIINRKF